MSPSGVKIQWTAEQDALIISGVHSMPEIHKLLGHSLNSVKRRRDALLYPEREENRKELARQGYQRNSGKIKQRAKDYRITNPERVLKRQRKYRAAHREELNEKNRLYHADNFPKVHAYKIQYNNLHAKELRDYERAYRKQYPDKVKASRRLWATNNPDSYNKHDRHVAQLPGVLTAKQWWKMQEYFDWCCVCCGIQLRDGGLQQDHIIPITNLDGSLNLHSSNDVYNRQPLCMWCNGRKSNRHATDYRPPGHPFTKMYNADE